MAVVVLLLAAAPVIALTTAAIEAQLWVDPAAFFPFSDGSTLKSLGPGLKALPNLLGGAEDAVDAEDVVYHCLCCHQLAGVAIVRM